MKYINEFLISTMKISHMKTQEYISKCKIFHEMMEFLLAICRGTIDTAMIRLLSETLNISKLKFMMIEIFEKFILKEILNLHNEFICGDDDSCIRKKCKFTKCENNFVTGFSVLLIDTAFSIFIFLRVSSLNQILSDNCKDNSVLKYFHDEGNYFEDLKSKIFQILNKQMFRMKGRDSRIVPSSSEKIGKDMTNPKNFHTYLSLHNSGKANNDDDDETTESIFEDKEASNSHSFQTEFESKKYFRRLVGSVEIVKDNEISRVYFKKPLISLFTTRRIKEDIIFKTPRSTDQERLTNFVLKKTSSYKRRMETRRKIDRTKFFSFFLNNWLMLKDLSLVLVLLINIFFLITFKKDENDKVVGNANVSSGNIIILALTCVQIGVSAFVLFGCGLEQYSEVEMMQEKEDGITRFELDMLGIERKQSIYGKIRDIALFIFRLFKKFLRKNQFSFFLHVFNFENAYNLLYLAISVLGLFFPLVYCFLLLDIVKRSDVLYNVIKAVTTNIKQLLLTLILGIVVIYLFSIIAFLELKEFYQGNLNAEKLYLAFATTINYGLRAGGGIGDALASRTLQNNLYWNAYAFELAFFIIVNLLFLNIIFGITPFNQELLWTRSET